MAAYEDGTVRHQMAEKVGEVLDDNCIVPRRAPRPNSESVKIEKTVRYAKSQEGKGESHRCEDRTRVEKDPGCKNGWAPLQEGCERKDSRALGGKSRTLTGGGSARNGGHGNSAIYSIIGR